MNFWRGLMGAIFALWLPAFGTLHVLNIITPPHWQLSFHIIFSESRYYMSALELLYWLLVTLFLVGIFMLNSAGKEVKKDKHREMLD